MKSRDCDKPIAPLSYDINYISDGTFRNNLEGGSVACESEDTAAHFLERIRVTLVRSYRGNYFKFIRI